MTGLTHQQPLPTLHPSSTPLPHLSSTPLTATVSSSAHQSYSHSSPNVTHMDPLDLLSRVALGQYPSAPSESYSRQTNDTWSNLAPSTVGSPRPHFSNPPMLKHEPLEPSPSPIVQDVRYRRLEYTPQSHAVIPPSTLSKDVPSAYSTETRDACRPRFSPVSSDDGMPSTSSTHVRQESDDSGRLTKIMRTSKDASIHKPRSKPSRFCHICSRTSKKVGLVSCGNFSTGACRKVICQKCFHDHGWDWDEAVRLGYDWICTHCRQACPDRAQCAIYRRTNERRREQQQYQRARKVEGRPTFQKQRAPRQTSRHGSHFGVEKYRLSEDM